MITPPRFMATVQDLDKEELKATAGSADVSAGLARKVGNKNAELGSVLGTKGVNKRDIQGRGGNVDRALDNAKNGAANQQPAATRGANVASTGLNSLPKLNVDEL